MRNLSEIIDTSGIIDRAFEQPAMKIKPRSAKRPDIDTAMRAVVNQIQRECEDSTYNQAFETITEAYQMHWLMYGSQEDAENKNEWESAVDDIVENAIEPWVPVLSQDWLGRMTIGTGLHSENGVENFCRSMAKEWYKQLVYERTPAQVMSSAGVVRKDIEAALAVHLQSTEKETPMSEQEQSAEFTALIEKMAKHIGTDPDNIMDIYSDIDLASDDDDVLAGGAAPRLGLDLEDIDTLRTERLMHGDDLPDVVMKAIEAYHEGPKKEKKPRKTKEELTAMATVKASKRVSVTAEETAAMPVVLTALKECGLKDEDMGKRLGVSRATYNNYATGKTMLEPDDAQLSIIRGELVDRANKLLEAVALLDGTDPHIVF